MELISREEAIKMVNKWFNLIELNSDILVDSINSIPTIEERKEGKWIKRDKWLYCSACDGGGWGLGAVTYEWQYCPLCGAKIGE